MSTEPVDVQALAETVRRGLGAGDRLVPGTMSEEEHLAGIALDALVAEVDRRGRERDAARATCLTCSEARERMHTAEDKALAAEEGHRQAERDYSALHRHCDGLAEVLRGTESEVVRLRVSLTAHHNMATLSDAVLDKYDYRQCPVCRAALAAAGSPTGGEPVSAVEFCGDEQAHERHEYLRGARRFECAGSPAEGDDDHIGQFDGTLADGLAEEET